MQPLEGVVVVEMARLLPAPLVGAILADLGATVIKIELLPRGDSLRGTELFDLVNRGKRSLAVTSDRLLQILPQLLAQSKILLTNYRPQTQVEIGLSPSRILQDHPHLIYVNVVGFADGRPGHDLNFLAESGVLSRLRSGPDTDPIVPGFLVGDLLGGTASALIRLLAALYRQAFTGQGCYIVVAMREEMLRWSVSTAHLYRLFGGKLPPAGLDFLSGAMPSYRVYRTEDGRYIAVAAIEEKFWQELCIFLGRPDLLSYGRSMGDPFPHREMERIFAEATWEEWRRRLEGNQFCVSPVYEFEEVIKMPWAAGIWREGILSFEERASVEVPKLGEHNQWVKERFGVEVG